MQPRIAPTGMAVASVIVRTKDEAAAVERTLSALRAQTVDVEIIVVDSGSRDGTPEIARRWCDQLVEIEPERFSFGRALNIGAEAALAPIHFALSAHCVPTRDDWIERSCAYYADPAVAATHGDRGLPDRSVLRRPLLVSRATLEEWGLPRANPMWGLSNHACSWRASVWRELPFNEELAASEDKEWASRVLDAGYLIAVDPDLYVDMSHRWRAGPLAYYRRQKKEWAATAEIFDLDPYGARNLVREWWTNIPPDRHSAFAHRFLNYLRFAELLGKYRGLHGNGVPG